MKNELEVGQRVFVYKEEVKGCLPVQALVVEIKKGIVRVFLLEEGIAMEFPDYEVITKGNLQALGEKVAEEIKERQRFLVHISKLL